MCGFVAEVGLFTLIDKDLMTGDLKQEILIKRNENGIKHK